MNGSSIFPVTYGSIAVNDQLLPTPMWPAFLPSPAIGPTFNTGGLGSAPLQTLPGGVATGSQITAPGRGFGAVSSMHVAIALAVMFVAGILILQYVHWR